MPLCLLIVALLYSPASADVTEDIFDAMELLNTGESAYTDPDYLSDLVSCMDQVNVDLKSASVNTASQPV